METREPLVCRLFFPCDMKGVPFPQPAVYVFELLANGQPVEGGVCFLRVLSESV